MKELTVAASCSLGRTAYAHDVRLTYKDNVTYNLSKDNEILIDEIKGKDIDDYIDMIMQPSIDEYNANKKPCRQIKTSYTEWHRLNENKGEMIYEMVMQYGEHDDLGIKYYQGQDKENMRREFIDIYSKWLKDWQTEHPNLKVLWAVIHFDEEQGTPHLHVAVCPISHDFKRGPKSQISMSKALESDGIKRTDNKKDGYQLQRAFEKFREKQERDLLQIGYKIKEHKHGIKHEEPTVYAEHMKELDERTEKVKNMEQFSNDVKAIEEQEKEITYGKSKKDMVVKTIPPKWGKEQMVVITQTDFNTLTAVTEVEMIKRRSEAREKKFEKLYQDTLTKLEKGSDEALRAENETLKKEVQQKEFKIRELGIEIRKKNQTINNLKFTIKELIKLIEQEAGHLLNKAMDLIKEFKERENEREH